MTKNSKFSLDRNFGFLEKLLGSYDFSKWSVTVRENLTVQLHAGIRYLDLRVEVNQENCNVGTRLSLCFYIVHGQYGNRLIEELAEIKRFLLEHLKEVVIIDLQHLYGFSIYHRLVLKRMFEKVWCLCIGFKI